MAAQKDGGRFEPIKIIASPAAPISLSDLIHGIDDGGISSVVIGIAGFFNSFNGASACLSNFAVSFLESGILMSETTPPQNGQSSAINSHRAFWNISIN